MAVATLKKVLEREYVSFFQPMQTEYYADDVTFTDPLTSLSGVTSYQQNVDMLASRTLLGKVLFKDASIVLHSVTGGTVTGGADPDPDQQQQQPKKTTIAQIQTRWTLRMCLKVLPWQPTARFTGVSLYDVQPGGSEGVIITGQTDYWDSINMVQDDDDDDQDTGRRRAAGTYQKVDKVLALQDFLQQLQSENGQAQAAGPEVPYSLLRRGKGYEIRRYPSYHLATIQYDRRDEGYDLLATITKGIQPLAPAIMEVPTEAENKTTTTPKRMSWPISYAAPGQSVPPPVPDQIVEKLQDPLWGNGCTVTTRPSTVVAVGSFSDASVAPVVNKADTALRHACTRDGITIPATSASSVKFAQYDAIFSLGKRRGEVWIDLEEGGHPY